MFKMSMLLFQCATIALAQTGGRVRPSVQRLSITLANKKIDETNLIKLNESWKSSNKSERELLFDSLIRLLSEQPNWGISKIHAEQITRFYQSIPGDLRIKLNDLIESRISPAVIKSGFKIKVKDEEDLRGVSFSLLCMMELPPNIVKKIANNILSQFPLNLENGSFIKDPNWRSYLQFFTFMSSHGEGDYTSRITAQFNSVDDPEKKIECARLLGYIGDMLSIRALAFEINSSIHTDTDPPRFLRDQIKVSIKARFPDEKSLSLALFPSEKEDQIWSDFCKTKIGVEPKEARPKIDYGNNRIIPA